VSVREFHSNLVKVWCSTCRFASSWAPPFHMVVVVHVECQTNTDAAQYNPTYMINHTHTHKPGWQQGSNSTDWFEGIKSLENKGKEKKKLSPSFYPEFDITKHLETPATITHNSTSPSLNTVTALSSYQGRASPSFVAN